MSQVNNPPEFVEAEEPRKSRVPAVLKRFPVVLILTAVFILACLLLFTRGHQPPAPRTFGGTRAGTFASRGNAIESPAYAGAPTAAKIEPAAAVAPTPGPSPDPTPAVVETARYEPPPAVAPAPIPSPSPLRRYQVVMRAGTPDEEARAALQRAPGGAEEEAEGESAAAGGVSPPAGPPESEDVALPIGAVLPLRLLGPLLVVPTRGTHARVRVTRDVKVSDELTILEGSEGYVSFVQLEGSDRVVADTASPGFLRIGDLRYALTGLVLGRDQYVGLKGKREKIDGTGRPGVLKRVGGRLAQQAAGRAGIYAGDVIDTYGRGGAAQYRVLVPADTLFTLTCGLK